jgi:hypothetical protein
MVRAALMESNGGSMEFANGYVLFLRPRRATRYAILEMHWAMRIDAGTIQLFGSLGACGANPN